MKMMIAMKSTYKIVIEMMKLKKKTILINLHNKNV
jgi:hypothetical protein